MFLIASWALALVVVGARRTRVRAWLGAAAARPMSTRAALPAPPRKPPRRSLPPSRPPRVPMPPPPGGATLPEPAAVPAPPSPPRAPVPAPTNGWETCEIDWWRGYLKSDFYAARPDEVDPTKEVARSAAFSWRSREAPAPEGPVADAHEALVKKLIAEGWTRMGTGAAWYQARFRRRVSD